MSGYRFDRLKVLVVDDNPHMRKIVATILQAFGVVQISDSPNAETAWKMLAKLNPDVLILDWMMEGMSGVDLAKMIRTCVGSPTPFVPIIMLSGYTSAERVRQARDYGVNEFLAKPVSARAVMTRLSAVIEHPRPFVRTRHYFGPCRRRRGKDEYQGPERRAGVQAAVR
ncbi:MAG TPA: response regulator [Rhizomicrobium sp.]|jgi:DNA-binding response OmpR family regulator